MTDIENTVLGIVQDTADYLDEPVLLSSRFMDIGINSVLSRCIPIWNTALGSIGFWW